MAVIVVPLEEQRERTPVQVPATPVAIKQPRCQGRAKRVRRGRKGRPIGYKGRAKGRAKGCKNPGSVEVNGKWYCRYCSRQYGFTL